MEQMIVRERALLHTALKLLHACQRAPAAATGSKPYAPPHLGALDKPQLFILTLPARLCAKTLEPIAEAAFSQTTRPPPPVLSATAT